MKYLFLLLAFIAAIVFNLPVRAQEAASANQTTPVILNLLPVTDDLPKAEQFYHQLLGLESPVGDPRARLVWYNQVPFLDDMYGVKGQSRNFFLRIPGSELNLEIEQFSGAKGKRLDTHLQDAGAVQLIFTVNNMDELYGRLSKGGAKVLTAGGKPVTLTDEGGSEHAVLFQDFNGFFVKLVQRDSDPKVGGANGAPAPSFITGVTIGLTIDNTEKTARFYKDVLGVEVKSAPSFGSDSAQMQALGLKGARVRESVVAFPDKSPQLHFYEFQGVARKPLHPLVADPNSVLIRIAVRDMYSVVSRVKAAGGQIMNVSGGPYLNGKNRWLIVTGPNGEHLQLVERNAVP